MFRFPPVKMASFQRTLSTTSGCADILVVNPGHSLKCKKNLLNYGSTKGFELVLVKININFQCFPVAIDILLLNFIIKGY